MKKEEIEAFALKASKGFKSQKDLLDFTQMLTKVTVEAALNAELDEHLGYEKNQQSNTDNYRNGSTSKTLKTEDGQFELVTPRDRNGTFEPELIKKNQTRFTSMDDKVLSLYARGMTTRDIVDTFKEMYDADISPTLVSKITNAVIDEVTEWQNRPLSAIYPIVYLDCIVVKIRQDNRVINKAVFLALAINLDGEKELLGLWFSENEGAKFWLNVLTELQNRGVEDILIACVDGLKGFPEAINTVYPETHVQLCIVHMIRNSLRFVSWKHYKTVTADLKNIYQADTEEIALAQLEAFGDKWDEQYPQISKSWINNWDNLNTFYRYPRDIRKAIYTTNAIESLNSVIRKAVKNRKVFPSDDSAKKVIYLAIKAASKKWSKPIHSWRAAMNRFIIEFEDRLKKHL